MHDKLLRVSASSASADTTAEDILRTMTRLGTVLCTTLPVLLTVHLNMGMAEPVPAEATSKLPGPKTRSRRYAMRDRDWTTFPLKTSFHV